MAMRFMRRLEALLYGMALYPVEGSEEVKVRLQRLEGRRPPVSLNSSLFTLQSDLEPPRLSAGAGGRRQCLKRD